MFGNAKIFFPIWVAFTGLWVFAVLKLITWLSFCMGR